MKTKIVTVVSIIISIVFLVYAKIKANEAERNMDQAAEYARTAEEEVQRAEELNIAAQQSATRAREAQASAQMSIELLELCKNEK